MIVLLDSNILALLVEPDDEKLSDEEKLAKESYQCTKWFYQLLSKGAYVTSSDLCDYEIRRELIRINSKSVRELDKLRDVIEFQKVTFAVLEKAAALWAEARDRSQSNKVKENIDVDCILAAHWCLLKEEYPARQVIIATKNIKDFQRVAECSIWQNITYL
ncbi:MAG: type II toxin-antitoxin system VapC family toxin [Oscillatoriales cyanobacterium RU_3_3]|nr:type II toxin-antitoxin system VapC family toxin [Oscillatoriales cyanobacterium RU_3_3]NJR22940.1 type II toxin-antitoxin system VapC family toxin [Richelia sp. CSU_2_1]